MNQIFLTQKSLMISNPSVSLDIVLISTAILVFSGVLAGVIPAIKASKIKPAIALRSL
jgi:putative ABC transport system permease protein